MGESKIKMLIINKLLTKTSIRFIINKYHVHFYLQNNNYVNLFITVSKQ